MHQIIQITDLGNLDYKEAWDLQERLLKENVDAKMAARIQTEQNTESQAATTQHHLLLVEHPPVYTLGKSGHEENVLINETELAKRGIGYFRTNRGGDITYHGPGQIVGYPIMDLEKFQTDIGIYLRNLEEVIIRTIALYGLKGERSKGETGVWLDTTIPARARKICAIGVRCSRWITMHGFALNVNTDLNYFNFIIPCGIRGKQVTSLAKELRHQVDLQLIKHQLIEQFVKVFDVEISASPASSIFAPIQNRGFTNTLQ
jgi:lipoyl(octanoyl) transferase